MAQFFNVVCLGLLPLSVVALLWFRKLSLQRDFLLIVFLGMSWIYLHLAPYLCAVHATSELQVTYAWLQAACLVLFEGLLTGLYLRRMARVKWPQDRRMPTPEPLQSRVVAAVSVGTIFLGSVFLKVSAEHGIFFRRIGHEGLARRSLELPFSDLILYRGYSELGAFIAILLLFLLSKRFVRTVWQKRVLVTTAVLHFLLYGVYVHINNRYQVGILYLVVFVALRYWYTDLKRAKVFTPAAIGLFFIALLLGMKVVSQSRAAMEAAVVTAERTGVELTPLVFLRLLFSADETGQIIADTDAKMEGGPLRERLNGLRLMALMTKPALRDGFMWGKAWSNPLMLYVYKFSDPEHYREIKMGMQTNAKVALVSEYLGELHADFPSSLLTDAYGNFFLLGLPLAALYAGLILSFISLTLISGTRAPSTVVLALFSAPVVFYFEKELISQWMLLIKFGLPVVLLYGLFYRSQRDEALQGGRSIAARIS